MLSVFRIRLHYHSDPDPGPNLAPVGSESGWKKLKKYSKRFRINTVPGTYRYIGVRYYLKNVMANLYKLKNNNKLFDIKEIPYWCSVFTSTSVLFLVFFTSWIRIRAFCVRIQIQEVSHNCESGSETQFRGYLKLSYYCWSALLCSTYFLTFSCTLYNLASLLGRQPIIFRLKSKKQ